MELIEVKYAADLDANRAHLLPTFEAAQAWAAQGGGTFRVATEREVRTPFLQNAKRLLPLRNAPID